MWGDSPRNMRYAMVERPRTRHKRLVKVVVLLFALSLIPSPLLPQVGIGEVDAYNCPNGSSCFGTYVWPGDTMGGITYISIVDLTYASSSSATIGNALWVYSARSPVGGCAQYGYGWAEAGYHRDALGVFENPYRGRLEYYRSEVTPGRGYQNVYDLPGVAPNEIGGILGIVIRPVPGQQRFRIELYHPNSAEMRETSDVNYNPGVIIFPATGDGNRARTHRRIGGDGA